MRWLTSQERKRLDEAMVGCGRPGRKICPAGRRVPITDSLVARGLLRREACYCKHCAPGGVLVARPTPLGRIALLADDAVRGLISVQP